MGQTEYLVTMTTHVPDGVSAAEVADVRALEAANTGRLAQQGSLRRLWRPPLGPDEWRTLGLFAANDDAGLEEVLSSMPLRRWRTDEVTPLALHPSDPGPDSVPRDPSKAEFLTTLTVTPPTGADVEDVTTREALRAGQLADEGKLRRLWLLPGEGHALGLWQARDSDEIAALQDSLPMTGAGWLAIDTVPLDPHPSDPASSGVA